MSTHRTATHGTRSHDTVVIGGGQAGLAASRTLTDRGIDHVVLERGRIAEAWRSQRWDSLRLLTPNWMTRLPGFAYRGHDPDGFMTMDEVAGLFAEYAASFDAPVRQGVAVTALRRMEDQFLVATTDGDLLARNVVVATGHAGSARIPVALAGALSPSIPQLHSSVYRNPEALPAGGVLVVGSGASGLQIADELARNGRRVVVSVGRHTRAVRRYRDRDLCWWLDQIGILEDTVDDVADIDAARQTPTLGLTGADGGREIDLGTLSRLGVVAAGRVVDTDGTQVRFGRNLGDDLDSAERRLIRLLDRIDDHVAATGMSAGYPWRPLPATVARPGPATIDLVEAGIGSVVWCTGFAATYPWLQIPVLDTAGAIRHRRGVTPVPGLFVLGLRFQWRRGSHFIDGVGADAAYVADRIANRAAARTGTPKVARQAA